MKFFSYGDIASFAEQYGHNYNQVIDLMEKDKFIPFYEATHKEIYKEYGADYGLSPELSDIFEKFIQANGEAVITE